MRERERERQRESQGRVPRESLKRVSGQSQERARESLKRESQERESQERVSRGRVSRGRVSLSERERRVGQRESQERDRDKRGESGQQLLALTHSLTCPHGVECVVSGWVRGRVSEWVGGWENEGSCSGQ